jgi:hypothetical protein
MASLVGLLPVAPIALQIIRGENARNFASGVLSVMNAFTCGNCCMAATCWGSLTSCFLFPITPSAVPPIGGNF